MKGLIIPAEDLEILRDKLISVQVTELNLWSRSFTGSLSVLLTKSLPALRSLTLRLCDLIPEDLRSLAKAEAEGKLPQLRHLDISGSGINDAELINLFTQSVQWSQLTSFGTSDVNVLNLNPELLASLEQLHMKGIKVRATPPITRQWRRLKIIEVWNKDIASCIAHGVERGMFPSLMTISGNVDIPISLLFKLYKANISVERNQFH